MPLIRKFIKETELEEMWKHPERFSPRPTIRSLVDEVRRLKVRLDELNETIKSQRDLILGLRSEIDVASMVDSYDR